MNRDESVSGLIRQGAVKNLQPKWQNCSRKDVFQHVPRYITLEGNRLSAASPRTLESFADDLPIQKLPDGVIFIFTNGIRQQLSELHLPIRVSKALMRAAESGRVIFLNETANAPEKTAASQDHEAASGHAAVGSGDAGAK